MFITLVAVIVALVLGHFAPALLASLRGHHWYLRWLTWWDAQLGESDFWRGRYGITVAVLPLMLLVALLQWSLSGHLFGLPSLLFGVGMLVLCWGPRDLDRDVEAILDADGVDMIAIALRQPWPDANAPVALALRLRNSPDFIDTGCCGDVVFLRYRRRTQ